MVGQLCDSTTLLGIHKLTVINLQKSTCKSTSYMFHWEYFQQISRQHRQLWQLSDSL